jgi:hypothetical protein
MARRKIEDEAEARRCLSAVEAGGGDIRGWAREHGIDGRSLHAWRVNFARWGKVNPIRRRRRAQSAGHSTSTALVELVPASLERRMPSSSGTCRYVLEVNGGRVEFDDNFSEPTLRRVLGILRSC